MKITDKSAKAEAPKPNAVIELPTVAHMPQQGWQHYCVKVEAGAPLDAFGDGWELVTVVPCLTDPAMVICYFKRRRPVVIGHTSVNLTEVAR